MKSSTNKKGDGAGRVDASKLSEPPEDVEVNPCSEKLCFVACHIVVYKMLTSILLFLCFIFTASRNES